MTTPFLADQDVMLYHGDALEQLRALPDGCVDMVACACGCGTTVRSPDAKGRPRTFARGHNLRVAHPELRLDPANLIVLCADCHRAEHREGVKP